MIFDVTVKQHLPLHQGHPFTLMQYTLLCIEENIQRNRFLSNIVFQA